MTIAKNPRIDPEEHSFSDRMAVASGPAGASAQALRGMEQALDGKALPDASLTSTRSMCEAARRPYRGRQPLPPPRPLQPRRRPQGGPRPARRPEAAGRRQGQADPAPRPGPPAGVAAGPARPVPHRQVRRPPRGRPRRRPGLRRPEGLRRIARHLPEARPAICGSRRSASSCPARPRRWPCLQQVDAKKLDPKSIPIEQLRAGARLQGRADRSARRQALRQDRAGDGRREAGPHRLAADRAGQGARRRAQAARSCSSRTAPPATRCSARAARSART